MDSSLNSEGIVCWDFEFFVIWVVSGRFLGDLGDFIFFGHVLAPYVGVHLLGNPCYIFTLAPGHMYQLTRKFMLQIVTKLIFTQFALISPFARNAEINFGITCNSQECTPLESPFLRA